MKLAAESSNFAYTQPASPHISSIETLTNPDSDLFKFELFLRNMYQNHQGTLEKIGEDSGWQPLVIDLGVNSIMSALVSVVHQMNTLSNFNENDFHFMIMGLTDTLAKDLMLNRLKYKLDRSNRDLIIDNAIRFAYGFSKRAFEEGDRKFWKGTVSEIKHTQEINKSRGSVLNPFHWRGKN